MATQLRYARLVRELKAKQEALQALQASGDKGPAQLLVVTRLAWQVNALQADLAELATWTVLDAVTSPLQRMKMAARLSAKVAEMVALSKPGGESGAMGMMLRARLAKEVNELLVRMGAGPTPQNSYGTCPKCGEPGVSTEKRRNGNSRCANGHTFPREAVPNEFVQTLTDIAEGGKDGRDLLAVWSLIYEAVEALQDSEALTGGTETLAHAAITRWAELEEKTNG